VKRTIYLQSICQVQILGRTCSMPRYSLLSCF
jgi:hypothetical protein